MMKVSPVGRKCKTAFVISGYIMQSWRDTGKLLDSLINRLKGKGFTRWLHGLRQLIERRPRVKIQRQNTVFPIHRRMRASDHPSFLIRVTRMPAHPNVHLHHEHFRKAFLGVAIWLFISNKSRTKFEPRIHQITLTVNLHPFELSASALHIPSTRALRLQGRVRASR